MLLFYREMKSVLPILVALACGVGAGWFLCWRTIKSNQPYQPIEEAKICYINLDQDQQSLSPQLREYLKARLYSAASHYITEGWLDGWQIDFGPVDDSVLGGVVAIKNASETREVYEAALSQHPRGAGRNKNAGPAAGGGKR